jgi:hypothetical protein
MVLLFFVFNFGFVYITLSAPANITIHNPTGTPEITGFFENVMTRLNNIIAYVAVLFIVIGGIMYVMSGMGGGNETLKKTAQNTLTFAIIGLAIAAAGPSFLKEIKTIVLGSPTASMPTNLSQAPTLIEIVRRALSFLLSIIGILAIISLMIGGIMYILAAGSVDIAKRATKTIMYSLIGIVVAGLALMLVSRVATLIQ